MLEIEDYYGIEDLEGLEIWNGETTFHCEVSAVLEAHGKRRLTAGLWSLLGPWAESLEKANQASTFNAKAETLAERPAYCKRVPETQLYFVPAEAFYEWVGPNKERSL